MKASKAILIAVCIALAIGGCGGGGSSGGGSSSSSSTVAETVVQQVTAAEPGPKLEAPQEPPPKNLVVKELRRGTGAEARRGKQVKVRYVGIRYDGEPFTNHWDGTPFTFHLGGGEAVPGWEKGIPGMRVGGRRELILPPKATYHPADYRTFRHMLGPEDTLVYVIELVRVEPLN